MMALMTWSNKFSVGVRTMDDQHTVLFDSLNELHNAMMKGEGQKQTVTLLRSLLKYTNDHFSAEEAMMQAAHYPDLAAHRAKHRDLTRQVQEFVTRYERGEAALNIQLLNFLRDWLANHIQGSDHEYGPWINSHGVK
jgi:hemerythrin